MCEASGKCLVRWSGTDPALTELAKKNAAVGAGHSFLAFLGDGFHPLNVLNTPKLVPEVCRLFCATANPTEVVLAETEQGRGILGVVDGFSPKGVEDEGGIQWRKDFLRKIVSVRPKGLRQQGRLASACPAVSGSWPRVVEERTHLLRRPRPTGPRHGGTEAAALVRRMG
jgi:adenosine/AMP kinase